MIRGPDSVGPPELLFNTRPASTARLLLAHATDTRMDPVLRVHIRDVSMCLPRCPGDEPGLASLGKASRGVLLCSLQSARTCLEGQCHRGARLLMPGVQWQEPGLIC